MVRPPPLLALVFLVNAAWAHDPGLGTTQLTFGPGGLDLVAGYAPADLKPLLHLKPTENPNWTQADFAAVEARLLQLAPQLWKISSPGAALAPDAVRTELTAGNTISFELHYSIPPSGSLTIESGVMDRLPPGHRDFLSAADDRGGLVFERLIDAQSGRIPLR